MLIQEQMKKGGSSSNLWALRQLADFMATHGYPAALPVSPSSKHKLPEVCIEMDNTRHQIPCSKTSFLFVFCFLLCFLNQFKAVSLLFPQSVQP